MHAIKRTILAGCVSVSALLTVAGGPASAAKGISAGPAVHPVSFQDAVPGIAPLGSDATAVYLNSAGQVVSPDADPRSEAEAVPIGCTPESGRDNPHFSSGDVSGHGWWKKGNCTNNRANVYNCLYEYYTDHTWRQKACSPTKQLRPYTGSGDRTVARAKCENRQMASWRNHVDVDVIGEVDTAEKPMNQADVACQVFRDPPPA